MHWLLLFRHNNYDEVMRKSSRFINSFFLQLSNGLLVKGGSIQKHDEKHVSAVLNVFSRRFIFSKLHSRIYLDLYIDKMHMCAIYGDVEEDDFHKIATYISHVLDIVIVDLPLLRILKVFNNNGVKVVVEGKEYTVNEVDTSVLSSIHSIVVGNTTIKKRCACSPDRNMLKKVMEVVLNES